MAKIFSFKGLITVLIVILAGSLSFFGFLVFTDFNEENGTSNSAATETGDSDEEASGASGEDTGETSGEASFENPGKFIAAAHEFYNDTTGYGALEKGTDWDKQSEKARDYLNYINNHTFDDPETLQSDMNAVSQYLEQIADGSEESDNVIQAHRYFHDLDIAINDYENYKEVWGVTETPANP